MSTRSDRSPRCPAERGQHSIDAAAPRVVLLDESRAPALAAAASIEVCERTRDAEVYHAVRTVSAAQLAAGKDYALGIHGAEHPTRCARWPRHSGYEAAEARSQESPRRRARRARVRVRCRDERMDLFNRRSHGKGRGRGEKRTRGRNASLVREAFLLRFLTDNPLAFSFCTRSRAIA